jgi:hypothetical protein
MRLFAWSALAGAILTALGCGNHGGSGKPEVPPGPSKDSPGVHIQAPGVDVKVKKDRGVDVQAPGTNVKVRPQE